MAGAGTLWKWNGASWNSEDIAQLQSDHRQHSFFYMLDALPATSQQCQSTHCNCLQVHKRLLKSYSNSFHAYPEFLTSVELLIKKCQTHTHNRTVQLHDTSNERTCSQCKQVQECKIRYGLAAIPTYALFVGHIGHPISLCNYLLYNHSTQHCVVLNFFLDAYYGYFP